MDDDEFDDFDFFDDGSDSSVALDSTDTGSDGFGDTSGADGVGVDSSGIDGSGGFDPGDGDASYTDAIDSGASVDTGENDSDGNPIVENSDGTFTTYDSGTGDPIAQYDSSGDLLGTFGDPADVTGTQSDTTTVTTTTDETLSYDDQGNLVLGQYADGFGNTVDMTMDENGNLVYSTYDSSGNLVSQTDENGNSLDGGSSVDPSSVGTGAAKSGGGGGSGGSFGGATTSGGGSSSGSGSSNSSALQALQSQLQALANALAAAQRTGSGVTVPQIQALQARAGVVNGQIANLGGTPSSLFPTTGASMFSGNTGTILLVGGIALAAILFTRRGIAGAIAGRRMKTTPSLPSLPPFRIEIRKKGSVKSAPWTLFGIALSEEQKDTKLADYPRHYPGWEFRASPNDWRETDTAAGEESELETLRELRASLIAECRTDDISYLAAAVATHEKMPKERVALESRANAAETKLREIQNPEGSAGASPVYTFGAGDTLRDIHTGVSVKVLAVGPEAKGGEGFDWEGPDGQFGHCPTGSVGCFEAVKKTPPAQRPKSNHKSNKHKKR